MTPRKSRVVSNDASSVLLLVAVLLAAWSWPGTGHASAPGCYEFTELLLHARRPDLAPSSKVESPAVVPGSFTFVVLPDMQYYSQCDSPHFTAQLRWIAGQTRTRDIRAVLTLGDLTEHNTPSEWSYVRDGLKPWQAHMPVILVSGNHDHGTDGSSDRRRSLLSEYFPQAPGAAAKILVETRTPTDIENAYYRVALPHVTIGLLALEWAPRTSTVAWANDVLRRHAGDRIIVLTHAYLYDDSTRYDWKAKGTAQLWSPQHFKLAQDAEAAGDPINDGQMLWDTLVRKHPGIFLVMNGHVGGKGTGSLASRGDAGNTVQQVLVNFQMLVQGGEGYLRLVEILPDGRTVRMKTYSPTIDRFAGATDQNAEFKVEPALWQ
jgi:hypothetical protein